MTVSNLALCMALLGVTQLSAAAECGDKLPQKGKQMVFDKGYVVAFVPSVWPIPVGKHFSLAMQVCTPAGKSIPNMLRVDADMPMHKHGMNYRTTVEDLGDGSYRADGLMFHMPGKWRFLIEIAMGPQNIQLRRELDIP